MIPTREEVRIDGRAYDVNVRAVSTSVPDVSMVMASHDALALTCAAVESIRAFAVGSYDLWVVDNASRDGTPDWLLAQPGVNAILNRTPAWADGSAWMQRMRIRRRRVGGSYSNAIALELAARYVRGRYMFVMQNDVLVLDRVWLPYVLGKISEQVRGVAMSVDHGRVNAMHSSGFLFDVALVRRLGLSFLPRLPELDCADAVTVALRRAGYSYHVCANTFNRPETEAWIPADHPLRAMHCDRVFDDDRHIIYAHLGRGTLKAAGAYTKPGRVSVDEWLAFAATLPRP